MSTSHLVIREIEVLLDCTKSFKAYLDTGCMDYHLLTKEINLDVDLEVIRKSHLKISMNITPVKPNTNRLMTFKLVDTKEISFSHNMVDEQLIKPGDNEFKGRFMVFPCVKGDMGYKSGLMFTITMDMVVPFKLSRMLDYLSNKAPTDYELITSEGKHLPCHKAVLASLSPVFKAMFTSPLNVDNKESLSLRDVTPGSVHLLLQQLYQTEPIDPKTVPKQDLLDLSTLINMYQMEVGPEHWNVEYDLLKIIDIDCAFELLAHANCFNYPVLKRDAKKVILEHYSTLKDMMQCEGWKQLQEQCPHVLEDFVGDVKISLKRKREKSASN